MTLQSFNKGTWHLFPCSFCPFCGGHLGKHQNMKREDEKTEVVYNIEEALEKTGFGFYNYKLIFTCGLILLAVNCECYSPSYILPAAECDLNLGVKEKSVISGMVIGGIMSGQFIWGYICDTKGRRNTLLYTLIASFISTCISSVAPNFYIFASFKFLTGLLIACPSSAVFAYLVEFTESKYRPTAIITSTIFIGAALIINPALGWIIFPIDLHLPIFGYLNFSSWRLYTLLIGTPSLLASFALTQFPESPKFLLQTGKKNEALMVLTKIYTTNTKLKDYPVKKLKSSVNLNKNTENHLYNFIKQIFSVFKLRFLKNSLLICFLQIFIFGVSGGIFLWYSEILMKLNQGSGNVTSCQAINYSSARKVEKLSCLDLDVSIFRENLILGAGYLVGYMIIASLIMILEFQPILVGFLLISGICGIALYWAIGNILINVLFMLFLLLSGLSATLVNSVVVEIYPTYLRATAVSVAMFSGRLGSFCTSEILGYMLEWNCDVTFIFYSSGLLCCAVLGLLIKTSKDIDDF